MRARARMGIRPLGAFRCSGIEKVPMASAPKAGTATGTAAEQRNSNPSTHRHRPASQCCILDSSQNSGALSPVILGLKKIVGMNGH